MAPRYHFYTRYLMIPAAFVESSPFFHCKLPQTLSQTWPMLSVWLLSSPCSGLSLHYVVRLHLYDCFRFSCSSITQVLYDEDLLGNWLEAGLFFSLKERWVREKTADTTQYLSLFVFFFPWRNKLSTVGIRKGRQSFFPGEWEGFPEADLLKDGEVIFQVVSGKEVF